MHRCYRKHELRSTMDTEKKERACRRLHLFCHALKPPPEPAKGRVPVVLGPEPAQRSYTGSGCRQLRFRGHAGEAACGRFCRPEAAAPRSHAATVSCDAEVRVSAEPPPAAVPRPCSGAYSALRQQGHRVTRRFARNGVCRCRYRSAVARPPKHERSLPCFVSRIPYRVRLVMRLRAMVVPSALCPVP